MARRGRSAWRVAAPLAGLGLVVAAAAVAAAPQPRFGLRAVDPGSGAPLDRSYFVFTARRGGQLTGALAVINSGDVAGPVLLYPVDAITGHTSGVVYRARGERRRGAGAWIRLETSALTLAPGDGRVVSFRVRVPRGASAGQHVAGIVAENGTLGGATTGPVRIRVRTLTILGVVLNVPGRRVARLTVGRVRAGRVGSRPAVVIRLRNAGTTLLRPRGRLALVDGTGRRLATVSLRLDTLVPRTAINYPVPLAAGRSLAGARYTLTLSYGARGRLRASGRVVS
jgi:hypothetical protein